MDFSDMWQYVRVLNGMFQGFDVVCCLILFYIIHYSLFIVHCSFVHSFIRSFVHSFICLLFVVITDIFSNQVIKIHWLISSNLSFQMKVSNYRLSKFFSLSLIEPIVNSRKQSQLRYSPYKHNHLELDVWYPDLNICFEYQVCVLKLCFLLINLLAIIMIYYDII